MRVVWKQVGAAPKVRSIPNALEALQELVGGYIEVLNMGNDLVLIVNEEGLLHGLGLHLSLPDYGIIVGDVVFAAIDGEDLRGLADDEIAYAIKKLEEMEI